MGKKALIFCFILLGISSPAVFVQAQDADTFTCFNAQEIHFPLENNDFSKSQILKNDRKINALYYLYQDKYSFWYKFIADETTEIQFSVLPTNKQDRYRAVVFDYGSSDFCDRLINENLQPMNLERLPIFREDGEIVYRNSIQASKGDTFYVSVLSLNKDDCGHFLYMESGDEKLSLHAIHGPCYNFGRLDVPDFSTAKMTTTDVDLELDLSDSETEEDTSQFASLKSIEIQNKEEGIVSVGDRLVLNNVFFYNNTYAFKPGAEVELNQLVDFLKANPSIHIELQGYTANDTEDIRPDPNFKGQGKEWNFKGSALELSEERANEVRDYLIDHDISKKRIEAKGFGAANKRVPDAKTFEESEKNMRVEALITKE